MNIYSPEITRYNRSIAQSTGDETVTNQSDDFPPIEHILNHWIGTGEAARIIGIEQAYVRQLCIDGHLRAKKIAEKWHIDPEAAENYQRYGRRDSD